MAIGATALDSNRTLHYIQLDRRPDICPLCHHAIELRDHFSGFYNTKEHTVQLVHRCPKLSCQSVFIATYNQDPQSAQFYFVDAAPNKPYVRTFSDTIQTISKDFCEIYNQSFASESQGHLRICGVGYRKALEFLMKDYLHSLHPHKAEEFRSKLLGKCIEEYVWCASMKAVAERAAWLNCEETHYVMSWEGKDLHDLKKLIELTVHWIEMDHLTTDVLKEIPDK